MENPFTIQRGKFEKRDYKEGIDSLISFDYMGSSEFEHGGLGESLQRIRENLNDYIYFEHIFGNGKHLTVFCKKDQKEDLPEILEKLAENEFRLQEYCDLNGWVYENREHASNRNDHWWEICHDYMFWKFNPEFTTMFKGKIEKK